MQLLTKSINEKFLRNGRLQAERLEQGDSDADFIPVVNIFTADANCTWLLTELDPEEPDIAFGLCDLGFGTPELGSLSGGCAWVLALSGSSLVAHSRMAVMNACT
tara:strand:- start:687 stop:1001 length:315 start_codon:yes stop_codon:yes gene_type:complete